MSGDDRKVINKEESCNKKPESVVGSGFFVGIDYLE